MRKISLTLGLALSVAMLGAGCLSTKSPVSLDKYQQAYATPNLSDNSTPTDQNAQTGTPAANPEAAPAAENPNMDNASSSIPNDPGQVAGTSTSSVKLAFPGVLPETEVNKVVHVKTTQGDFWFELLPKEGPKAASNFVYLTTQKFYNNTTFHRYVPDFVIQGGDPQTKSPERPELYGTGGPGYKFEDDKVNLPYKRGIVAMANSGANTNGSQFFVVLKDTGLDPLYSVFGRVTKGMEVVDKLRAGDRMLEVTLENK